MKTLLIAVTLAGLAACKPAREEGAQCRPNPVLAPVARLALAAGPERTLAPLPSLAPLVDAVKGAVVNVEVQVRARPAMDMTMPFLFPGGRQFRGQPQMKQGAGSGFIIEADGHVITNNHVVADASVVRVRLPDGRAFDADVLGRDPATDVALLKMKGDVGNLPVVKLGDSDAMRVGDWVVAIGNPFRLSSSVSAGIISALGRDINAGPYDEFLQTDAAINPGNSGGPLFNLAGEVIGMNTAIASETGQGAGIGFAVPSNLVKTMLPQLTRGQIKRGRLGVEIQDLTPDLAKGLSLPVSHGALVSGVQEATPASRAGLRTDDVITAVGGKPIDSSKALTRAIGFSAPGTQVVLTYYRGATQKEVKVTLAEFANPQESQNSRMQDQGSGDPSTDKLGLSFKDAPQGQPGALISEVEPDSAADRAELQPGMVVTRAGNKPVKSGKDLYNALKGAPHGSELVLGIQALDGTRLTALAIP